MLKNKCKIIGDMVVASACSAFRSVWALALQHTGPEGAPFTFPYRDYFHSKWSSSRSPSLTLLVPANKGVMSHILGTTVTFHSASNRALSASTVEGSQDEFWETGRLWGIGGFCELYWLMGLSGWYQPHTVVAIMAGLRLTANKCDRNIGGTDN